MGSRSRDNRFMVKQTEGTFGFMPRFQKDTGYDNIPIRNINT